MFSELLLWGWLRRVHVDHQVSNATRTLGLSAQDVPRPTRTSRHQDRLLRQLAAGLEAQDVSTDGHSRRVARRATMIARKMGLSREETATVRAAALVHDVGKLHVPRQVLNKPSKLSPNEFQIVKRHPELGAEMVACLQDADLAAIVRHHHERLDGSGYPDGLRGEQISLGARIVAVADMFDAITTPRPYRPAASHRQAFQTLEGESGTLLDPDVVQAFLSCYSGRGPLAWWMALGSLVEQVAWARSGGIIRRHAVREVVSGGATTVAVAAAAIAAPVGLSRQLELRHPHLARTAAAAARTPQPPAAPSVPRPRQRPSRSAALRTVTESPVRPVGAHRNASRRNYAGRTREYGLAPRVPTRNSAGRGSPPAPSHPPAPPAAPTMPPNGAPNAPPVSSPATPVTTAPAPPTSSTAPGTTTTGPTLVMPSTKDQCRDGGYAQYGFPNQGHCIAFVEHPS